jgi:hypothetical protein
MMKKYSIILLMVGMFITAWLGAQDMYTPTKIRKAAFFDKSPALRDLPQIQMKAGDGAWKNGIDKNNALKYKPTGNENVKTDPKSVQSKQGTKSTKGPIVNINGTGNVNGVYPPDTDGDVSPDHYVQMINLSFAVYDKNGTKLYGPTANSTLWSGFPGPWSGTNDGDPIIIWDDMAERWVASQFAVSTSNGIDYELIAVSVTSDPLGEWYRYAFEFDMFPDYPKISAWSDGYYATFHMFQGGFQGTAYVAWERDKMLVGDEDAQMVYFGEFGSRWGYLPADADGVAPPAGEPCYFTGINFWGNQNMQIYKMTVDWDNPTNSSLISAGSLNTDAFNSNTSSIPQPGTGQQLDAFNTNLMYRLPYRNFGTYQAMAATHTVTVGSHTAIRWYEVRDDGAGWYIYQQGTYDPDSDNRWLPSIALSENGNIAVGYSVSSSSVYPSLRYAGRTADAPLGELNIAEVEVVTGLSSQSGINRWGDYASMTSDPSDPNVFWFTSEYMKSSGWGTRIVSFDFEDLQQPEVYAGNDTTICESVLFETAAWGLYYYSVQWESDGDGVFQNANSINAKYLRGPGDIENGGVTLSITAQGYESGWEATDEVYVSIVMEPEANAGNDTTIHMNHVANLNGQAGDYSSVIWTTNGDGYFGNAGALQTYYDPGTNDIANGSVQLTLTVYADEACEGEDSDNVTITIDPTVGFGQSADVKNKLSIVPNPTNGNFKLRLTDSQMDENYMVSIMDYTGRKIFTEELNFDELNSKTFDLSTYPNGIYFVEIKSDNLNVLEKLIVK